MRCFSDVLKKTLPPDVFGDVLEKVKHLTNDAFNDVSRPALGVPPLPPLTENHPAPKPLAEKIR